MNYYLVQAAYTADAVPGLVKNPHNCRDPVQNAVEKLGGSSPSSRVVSLCRRPWRALDDCVNDID